MTSHGLPSPSSSGRYSLYGGQPATPPGHTGALHQYTLAPAAPYMYTHQLPPSPHAPGGSGHHVPQTPYMGSVPLPPAHPAAATYGLMTPPASPEKSRRSSGGSNRIVLHPYLTPQYFASNLGNSYIFDLRQPVQSIRAPPSLDLNSIMTQSATNPPVNYLTIIAGGAAVQISSPHGFTVGDLLHQLQAALCRRIDPVEMTRLARYRIAPPGSNLTPGQLLSSFVFAGLSPDPAGSGAFILHTA